MPKPTAIQVVKAGELTLAEESRSRAKAIQRAWKVTLEANRRGALATVIFGIFLVETRAWGKRTGQIPHSEFLPWLEKQTPDIHHATAYRWMEVAQGVLDTLQISHNAKFDDQLLHQALTLPEKKLSTDQAALRKALYDLVEGKSLKQLRYELCDVETVAKGGFHPDLKKLEKWLKKNHPDLLSSVPSVPSVVDSAFWSSLPPKIQRAFKTWCYSQLKGPKAKEAAEALMLQGIEELEDLRLAADIVILKGQSILHITDKSHFVTTRETLEEATAKLRELEKGSAGILPAHKGES